MSTKIKIIPELNLDVHKAIESEDITPKKHPGVLRSLPSEVPEPLFKAIKFLIRDKPIKTLIKDGIEFTKYLEGRHPPLENDKLEESIEILTKQAMRQCGVNINSMDAEEQFENKKKSIDHRLKELLKQKTYNWKPINYDDYLSYVYLVNRTAPEYAAVCRVFYEIFTRDKSFEPKSLFDFGSGVGTVSWGAKKYWGNFLKEFYYVDISSHMNDIAQALIQDGKINLEPPSGVYFRQFLPSKNDLHDIVVSSYSLFELPSREARLQTVLNLWNKTKHYLVIIERGTNAGFKLVNEARDFILFSNRKSKVPSSIAHVFAPCPHDKSCPQLMKDNTPCNFIVNFNVLPFDNKQKLAKERFSFVIVKKGERDSNSNEWPRIVRPVLKRSKHCICQLCTPNGKLKEIFFTAKKNGKIPYLCARSSRWGDILPMKLNEKEVTFNDVDDAVDYGKEDNHVEKNS